MTGCVHAEGQIFTHTNLILLDYLAERVGFEPTIRF